MEVGHLGPIFVFLAKTQILFRCPLPFLNMVRSLVLDETQPHAADASGAPCAN